jgi:hypothetical protein
VSSALAARGVLPGLSRASAAVAAIGVLSAALPGAIGWYAFLAAFFGWTGALAGGFRVLPPVVAATAGERQH